MSAKLTKKDRELVSKLQQLRRGDSYDRVTSVLGRPITKTTIYYGKTVHVSGYDATYIDGDCADITKMGPDLSLIFNTENKLRWIMTNIGTLPPLDVPVFLIVCETGRPIRDFVIHHGKSRELKPGESFDEAAKE
jgi:hypothetical protein